MGNNRNLWLPFLISGLIGVLFWFNRNDRRKLKESGLLTNGYVYKTFGGGNRSSKLGLKYSYILNDKNYESSNTYIKHSFSQGDRFEGKYFPVIYDKQDPSNSKILIDRDDFNEYRLDYPDSLIWIDALVVE